MTAKQPSFLAVSGLVTGIGLEYIYVLVNSLVTMAGIGYPSLIPEPQPKFGYGLGLCLNTMGIFGLGTNKVLNFEFFWVRSGNTH